MDGENNPRRHFYSTRKLKLIQRIHKYIFEAITSISSRSCNELKPDNKTDRPMPVHEYSEYLAIIVWQMVSICTLKIERCFYIKKKYCAGAATAR